MVSDKRMIRNRFGFTVVEVLVAMTVLTIGLLGILGVTGTTLRLLGNADRSVAAAYYASERMERLGSVGCDAASSGSEVRQGIYNLSWTVSADSGGGMRRLWVTAQYPGAGGAVRADTFETAILCAR